jgi:hypothetical protein
MRRTTLAICEDGNCPQIDQRSDGDFEVQGLSIATPDKPNMPAGHDRVRIPHHTMISMLNQLRDHLG